MDESHNVEQKKPDIKEYVRFDSIYLTFKTGKTNPRFKILGCWLP